MSLSNQRIAPRTDHRAAVEGWIVIVTGLNEETAEEDVQDFFADFGDIRNLSMPLNRRTGYVMVSVLCLWSQGASFSNLRATPDNPSRSLLVALLTPGKGYALIEYGTREEAEKAIKETDGQTFLEKTIQTSVNSAPAAAAPCWL